jgi:hypothetical protein
MKRFVKTDRGIEAGVMDEAKTLLDTVDTSAHETVNTVKQLELIDLLSDTSRFDFSSIAEAWGGRESNTNGSFIEDRRDSTL